MQSEDVLHLSRNHLRKVVRLLIGLRYSERSSTENWTLHWRYQLYLNGLSHSLKMRRSRLKKIQRIIATNQEDGTYQWDLMSVLQYIIIKFDRLCKTSRIKQNIIFIINSFVPKQYGACSFMFHDRSIIHTGFYLCRTNSRHNIGAYQIYLTVSKIIPKGTCF